MPPRTVTSVPWPCLPGSASFNPRAGPARPISAVTRECPAAPPSASRPDVTARRDLRHPGRRPERQNAYHAPSPRRSPPRGHPRRAAPLVAVCCRRYQVLDAAAGELVGVDAHVDLAVAAWP